MRRRVAITGIGVVCALGANREDFWQALQAGRSGIGPLRSFEPGLLRFPNAAEIAGFDPSAHFEGKELNYLDRFAQLGSVAAREALADAGLKLTAAMAGETAVVTGTSLGGKYTEDAGYWKMYGERSPRFDPLTITKAMPNAATSRIALEHGITGPAWTVSTACSSSNHAIGQAFRMVRDGDVEFALAGGAEAPFTLGVMRAWEAMRIVAPDTCRPFSRDRQGLILGEGAAVLVMEPLEGARARGARVYGLLSGFGMSSDAHHITQPKLDGAVKAMRVALRDADLTASEVAYINAHGTGTTANDSTETAAIREVFGSDTEQVLVSSTKSMHGHTLGAAGAIEAAATLLAIREGTAPPTANYRERDPACDLDCVPNESRELVIRHAMSNSFAFGGLNAVLVFSAIE